MKLQQQELNDFQVNAGLNKLSAAPSTADPVDTCNPFMVEKVQKLEKGKKSHLDENIRVEIIDA